MMNILKQVWYEMRQQPLVTWVTVSGTAISIFLIMVLYMVGKVDTVPAAPEVNRDRTLYAPYLHVQELDQSSMSSGSLNNEMMEKLYKGLPGVKVYAVTCSWSGRQDVNVKGGELYGAEVKPVDAGFWKLYRFDFTSGKPFTASQVKADMKVAVLTEKVARELGKGADMTGREVLIGHVPYRVAGVVKNTSPLLKNSFSDIYVPYVEDPGQIWSTYLGQGQLTMLLDDDADVAAIKAEVKRRYEVLNDQLKKEGKEAVYHQSPFTAEEMASEAGSNNDPDTEGARHRRWILYGLLLLVPAINLGGMTRSRLKKRVSEIGVRRAYGAKRTGIAMELVGENFLLTLGGGVIGLLLSVVFITAFSHLFVDYLGWSGSESGVNETPAFTMLFSWGMFGMLVASCFVLNLLSTGIPAWKASRVNPAEAIAERR